jgi:K(+)-stimulated pyrophosphate-energized sodium pump
VTALGACELGRRSGLHGGGLFGLAVAGLGLLGSAPLLLATDGVASIVDSARGMVEMTVGAERPDVRARARILDAVGAGSKGLSGALAAVASAVGCFLLVGVFQGALWQRRGAAVEPGMVDLTSPLPYVGALAGLLVVVVFSWATLTRLVQAVRAFILELRAQLANAPAPADQADDAGARAARLGPSGDLARPAILSAYGYGASHGTRAAGLPAAEDRSWQGPLACVEIVSRHALRGMLPPALLGVGLPLAIGAALRLWASGDNVIRSAEALVALLSVATIAGALASLLFSIAGSAWDNAKKYIETGAHGGRFVPDPRPPVERPARSAVAAPRAGVAGQDESWADNPTYVAAAVGDTIGDSLKGLVGPSLQALIKTLSALALVFLPLFL